MFYLMKSKYALFPNIKVTKIELSAFLGHPVYRRDLRSQGGYTILLSVSKCILDSASKSY